MSDATPDLHVGTVLDDRYRIDELIARGGMAAVYRALDLRLGRTVAIKILAPAFTADPGFVDRFILEARSAAALTHPNVVAVHDQGVSGNSPYLVMEYVPGRTIRQLLAVNGAMTSAHALEIMKSVLAGLAAAHDAGFVHRDIKPENVLITDSGLIKVTDFGLARVIDDRPVSDSTGAVLLGTMAYLSPEQVQQRTVDQRSDVYSAGILLFEMLTGRVPYTGESPLEVAYAHVNNDVPAPSTLVHDVPPSVDHLVLAATRRNPNDRFANALVFLDAVNRAASAVPAAEALTTVLPAAQTIVMANPGIGSSPLGGSAGSGTGLTNSNTSSSGRRATTKRVKRNRIIAATILIGAILGGLGWYFLSGTGIPVPNVAGQSVSTATLNLERVGFKVGQSEVFSETVPNGTVVGTDPAGDSVTRKGRTVTLLVSKGQERYIIPSDLAGKDPNDATNILQDLTLRVSKTNEVYANKIPLGKVVSTNPKGGSKVKRNTAVILNVSKGPKPVIVPRIAGENIQIVTKQLEKLGLVVDIKDQIFDTSDVGTVISSDPTPGTSMKKGETIHLTVSKGPPPVAVPNVVGLDVDTAKQILTDAGFEVNVTSEVVMVVLNKVYSQDPPSGSMATPGTTITITIV
ncbi:MAG: Stk1 family PASTA domain-containing Ser/Thr kinase [Actinomycetales bacterium]|nr:Stk1 family PASTA domain-containing Ser/Thr kinase [Actinomycetales bacterium]